MSGYYEEYASYVGRCLEAKNTPLSYVNYVDLDWKAMLESNGDAYEFVYVTDAALAELIALAEPALEANRELADCGYIVNKTFMASWHLMKTLDADRNKAK
tara:strand:+ start:6287 stop:6589 length:303 start_codon:yes stop_codon:yes gene_type:complete